MTIRQATVKVCIREQIEARRAARHAMEFRDMGAIGPSIFAQRNAKKHAEEAMLRLFRLIGVE